MLDYTAHPMKSSSWAEQEASYRSIYTARFIVWQPRRAADTSTNQRQSLFCCCTATMEQATDGAETAAID